MVGDDYGSVFAGSAGFYAYSSGRTFTHTGRVSFLLLLPFIREGFRTSVTISSECFYYFFGETMTG
jgi:hypothetical protein